MAKATDEDIAWALVAAQRDQRCHEVAQRFHELYEMLAPKFGYETRPESAVPWRDVPVANKRLMRAVVSRLIDEGLVAFTPELD